MGWLNRGSRESSWYDVAQICPNGRVINSAAKSRPEYNAQFCSRCGEKTTAECAHCHTPVRGSLLHDISWSNHQADYEVNYVRPSFCRTCGEAYPWTHRKLEAAKDLARELDGLDDAERQLLANSLDDIVRDTPSTSVAATRFKRLVAKGGAAAAEMFKDILTDIVSETAKKMIWG